MNDRLHRPGGIPGSRERTIHQFFIGGRGVTRRGGTQWSSRAARGLTPRWGAQPPNCDVSHRATGLTPHSRSLGGASDPEHAVPLAVGGPDARSWHLDRSRKRKGAETMAMPYEGGARLDMESLTPLGRRSPGTPTCFQQVDTAKAPQPSRLEPDGKGAFSMKTLTSHRQGGCW